MSNWLMKNTDVDFADSIAAFYKRVLEWNTIAGNDIGNPNLKAVYEQLVREEVMELREAFSAKCATSIVSELVDVMVVGSYLNYLIDGEVRQAQSVRYNTEGLSTTASLESYIDYLEETSLDEGYLNCALYDAEPLAYSLDVDFNGALIEVMDSNFSKFMPVKMATEKYSGDMEKVCRQIEEKSNGRYTGVTSQCVGDYIVFRDSKGKIVKPPCFRAADVSRFIPDEYLKGKSEV